MTENEIKARKKLCLCHTALIFTTFAHKIKQKGVKKSFHLWISAERSEEKVFLMPLADAASGVGSEKRNTRAQCGN